jgi:hypothetical protein
MRHIIILGMNFQGLFFCGNWPKNGTTCTALGETKKKLACIQDMERITWLRIGWR